MIRSVLSPNADNGPQLQGLAVALGREPPELARRQGVKNPKTPPNTGYLMPAPASARQRRE